MESAPYPGKSFDQHAVLLIGSVFLGAFLVRLYVFCHTYIINPDGVLYIHQARAIYFKDWHQLFNCHLSYLSNYPFLIALLYPLTDNWHLSARLVSFIFGFGTLFPIFFLFRRFFSLRTSLLGLAVFALIPNHVTVSADAMREPVAWFFACLGLLLFVLQNDKKRQTWLLASGIAFILAAWARIEFVLLFMLSGLFLLFFGQPRKIAKIIFFTAPLALVSLLAIIGLSGFDLSTLRILRINEVFQKVANPFRGYISLQSQISQIETQTGSTLAHFFLPEANNFAWLVALGALSNRMLEGFFYPFFLFFILGLRHIRERLRIDPWTKYFVLIICVSLFMLYFHVLNTWMLAYRFIGIVIFPAFLLLGYGLENIFDIMTRRYHLKEKTVLIGLCAVILTFGLIKNLQNQERDKLVYRNIAETITVRENTEQRVKIAGINTIVLRYIRFYANEKVRGAPCPSMVETNYDTYSQLKEQMIQDNIHYFFWEENAWRNHSFDLLKAPYQGFLKPIGEWYHRDTERLILFERVEN